jgi:THO complex subunit 1
VLPVISEANKKERLLMGSKAMQGSTKRRRENVDSMEETKQDYFFAKFLTSPELLDLEVSHELTSEVVV